MSKRSVFVLEYYTGKEWRFYARHGEIAPWYSLADALSAARVELRRGAWSFCITQTVMENGNIRVGADSARIVKEGSTIEEAK